MSDKSQKGCKNVRVWSNIVGSIHAGISLLVIILLTATLAIYHREDIQKDKSEGSLAGTSITGYIIGLLVAICSFACDVLMLRGFKLNRTKFILPSIFCNALIIVVSIFGAIVEFVIDLVHKKTLVASLGSFALEFVLTAILFIMMIPIVLHYNNLKARPYSAHVQGA